MAKKNGNGKEIPLTPLYSGGTKDQEGKDNQGTVDGPKSGPPTPDPLGYLK